MIAMNLATIKAAAKLELLFDNQHLFCRTLRSYFINPAKCDQNHYVQKDFCQNQMKFINDDYLQIYNTLQLLTNLLTNT